MNVDHLEQTVEPQDDFGMTPIQLNHAVNHLFPLMRRLKKKARARLAAKVVA